MGVRVSRDLPPSGVPTRYEIYRGAAANALTLLDVFVFVVGGPHHDAANKKVFYDDETGDASLFYRLIAFDVNNIILDDSGPFAFSPAVAASLPTRTKVDHHYGAVDALRYVAPGGAGVPQARVRIYKQPDYLAGRWELAVATTETADDGRWLAPVYLEPGFTYVVHFSKEGVYGPDTTTVVV